MVHSIIQKSQLEGASRLDAEYYQPEYFIDFSKGDWVPIGSILEACQYGISQSMNEDHTGPPIFRMDDIKDAFLVNDGVKYVNIAGSTAMQYRLDPNDLLFNRVNSEEFVGRTGIFKLEGKYVFASYLIRLRTKTSSHVNADYLNIFLNSSYGIKQIKKYMRRAVNQANVNAEELKQMKILVLPPSFQEKIKMLSDESWKQRQSSTALYSQAENLLLEELELKDFKVPDNLSFVVNLSEVQAADRIDGDYFQPKYEKILQQISRNNLDPLEKHFDVLKSKSFAYSDMGEIGVIKTKQLGKRFINFEVEDRVKLEVVKTEKLPALNDLDVTFASMGVGSLGKTNVFYDFESPSQKYTIDSTLRIFRAKTDQVLPEVLAVYLNSWLGQELIYKCVVGSSGIISIYEDYLKHFPVPLIDRSIQQKIANLVRRSHEARKTSKDLLEVAKRKVEEMIENGGGGNGSN